MAAQRRLQPHAAAPATTGAGSVARAPQEGRSTMLQPAAEAATAIMRTAMAAVGCIEVARPQREPRGAPPTARTAAASRPGCRRRRPAPRACHTPPPVPRTCGFTADSSRGDTRNEMSVMGCRRAAGQRGRGVCARHTDCGCNAHALRHRREGCTSAHASVALSRETSAFTRAAHQQASRVQGERVRTGSGGWVEGVGRVVEFSCTLTANARPCTSAKYSVLPRSTRRSIRGWRKTPLFCAQVTVHL